MKKFVFYVLIICPILLFSSNIKEFSSHPLIGKLIYTVRDPQTDKQAFQKTMKNLGVFLGYEIIKDLPTKRSSILTVLGEEATHTLPDDDNIVLITVLRAGNPLYQGLQKVFPKADIGFFGAMRNEETLLPTISYIAIPDIKDKYVILSDPMIATGGSLIHTLKIIVKKEPKKIFIMGVISSKAGIEAVQKSYPSIPIYTAVIDPILNDKGYIVPGLGDAGDRSFGAKL